jgi:hypothetical protein
VLEGEFGPLLVDCAKLGAPLAVPAVEHEEFFAFAQPEHVAEIVHLVLIEFDRAGILKRRLDE